MPRVTGTGSEVHRAPRGIQEVRTGTPRYRELGLSKAQPSPQLTQLAMQSLEHRASVPEGSVPTGSRPLTPAPPSGPQSPRRHGRHSGRPPATVVAMLATVNPFSSEGQELWEGGQGRGCEPRPAVRVWILISSRKVHFPCQGARVEGREARLCGSGLWPWAPHEGPGPDVISSGTLSPETQHNVAQIRPR